MVDVAVGCGADIIKFQTFSADTLGTTSANKAVYQYQNTDNHYLNKSSWYNQNDKSIVLNLFFMLIWGHIGIAIAVIIN